MQIIAKVRFNSGFAYVLDWMPNLEYFKIGNSIVGTDGIFLDCYYYERPSKYFQAFAGRKFDLTMQDGEIVHCDGQWWDGVRKEVENRFYPEEIINVTIQTARRLKECYCFTGYRALNSKFKKLVSKYTGNTYDYREYEALIK